MKSEIVWERVPNDSRSQELGLITGKEDEEELKKCKRLTDEVHHEMRRARQGTRKRSDATRHIASVPS